MALAARSLRIEAPIPGKSAVGIEIPNKDFNVVALRRILEELDFKASGSTLTFALGRDVAGKAQAVDLAKMPHLLIAGATGSGKSVMVNALITSLLCEATPDDVRMILMDLKRVELAAYNGLPHLLVPVITEPERAKAALKWAVNEMEARYRRLAGATARNIRAFNETRVDPEDRMPYIVIVIDELADLMMREGKNVEDPIVRLAQKARATGHPHGPRDPAAVGQRRDRPHQGQLPEPDRVRDGVPDRLADDPRRARRGGPHRPRRHALPAVRPAPPDAPPGRLRVRCRDRPGRRPLEGPDRGPALRHGDHRHGRRGARARSTTSPTRTPIDCLPDAIEVIREYDRASASLLQRRLKVGYARAARMIDQLEARGYIGAFDGSNARQVLRRDGHVERPPGARRTTASTRTTDDDTASSSKRAVGGRPVATPAAGVTAEPAPTLPERLYAARERKGVDLYRAERDTKIRARYLGALERGDYRELPGAVYTKGFLRNYALYLGLDPDEVLVQWRRERGDGKEQPPAIVVPAADRGAAPGADLLAGPRSWSRC